MSDLISRADAQAAICRDGVRLEREGVVDLSLCTAKQWAVDVLDEIPAIGGWIPCKDELPEDEDTYLVTWRPRYNPFDCNFMWLLSWEGGEWVGDISSAKYYGDGEYDILAWMPLPNAYVEGAE